MTLWLRPDDRFLIRQRYLADQDSEEIIAHSLGRWSWVEADRTVVLVGEGPPRTFTRPGPDTLIMQTDSELEHRLSRDPQAPDFTWSVRLAGMMSMPGKRAVFRECLTGLSAPVKEDGDYGRFRHQYRSVAGAGEPAFVEFEGRFGWSADGTPASFTIDRFISVKQEGSC